MKIGKMPSALAKYWAKRRGAKKRVNVAKRRAANPAPVLRGCKLVIEKGGQRLHYVGDKFAASGAPVVFPTLTGAKVVAKVMHKKFAHLHSYKWIIAPVRG